MCVCVCVCKLLYVLCTVCVSYCMFYVLCVGVFVCMSVYTVGVVHSVDIKLGDLAASTD